VKHLSQASGVTLVELLMATVVTLIALATVLAVALPWTDGVHVLGEAADVQQRARVAAASLTVAIQRAGAGSLVDQAARLPRAWPAVLPCRWTSGSPACSPTADAITVLGMVDGLQMRLAEDMASSAAPLAVSPVPGCASTAAACRFAAGDETVIADASGARDEFVVTGVSADGTLVTHVPAGFSRAYRAGAIVGRSSTEAFYARVDSETGALQLRSARGGGDFPLLDALTGLAFEYFGDPAPPSVIGFAGGRVVVSYGPEPPPAGQDDPADVWPAGENCTFAATSMDHVPRLPHLPADADGLARLPLASLADGPWCPDAWSPSRFDADLTRLRRVRIRLRLQAPSALTRGTDPRLFSRPGSARRAVALVPDMEVIVDVALRNAR
jgi:hypothetical protein